MPQGLHAVETNEFGIHEFMRLCRLVGAEPYVAANVGSGTPQEFHDWVSYCNAPAGTLSLADERAAQRRPGAVQRQVLGRGQRIVGLRRQHDAAANTPPSTASSSRSFPSTCARSSWRRGRAGTPPTATSAGPRASSAGCRTCAASASGWTALRCTTTPTSVRPPKTARSSTRRAGTPSCTRACTSRT